MTVWSRYAAGGLALLTAMALFALPGQAGASAPVSTPVADLVAAGVRVVDVNSAGQVASSGVEYGGSITPDGRYVLFHSGAKELPHPAPGPSGVCSSYGGTPVCQYLYRRDLRTGQTVLLDERCGPAANIDGGVAPLGTGRVMSDDGRYVVYVNYRRCDGQPAHPTAYGWWHVWLLDTETHQVEVMSKTSTGDWGKGGSGSATISGDGRYVAFDSSARNLEEGDTRWGTSHVYVHDRQTGQTRLVDRLPDGTASTTTTARVRTDGLSADGRTISYLTSLAADGPTQYDFADRVQDLTSGRDRRLGTASQPVYALAVSRDGRYGVGWTWAGERTVGVLTELAGTRTTRLPTLPGGGYPDCPGGDVPPSPDNRYLTYVCSRGTESDQQFALLRWDRSTGSVTRLATGSYLDAPVPLGITARGEVMFSSTDPRYGGSTYEIAHLLLTGPA